MAMGLPVLHGVAGESAAIVEREGNGIVFEPENATALSAGLRRLVHEPDLRDQLARRGPIAAQAYDRKALAARMLSVLETVAAAPRR
jgi:glycosyltransferase involved in cell wall biosynthesis